MATGTAGGVGGVGTAKIEELKAVLKSLTESVESTTKAVEEAKGLEAKLTADAATAEAAVKVAKETLEAATAELAAATAALKSVEEPVAESATDVDAIASLKIDEEKAAKVKLVKEATAAVDGAQKTLAEATATVDGAQKKLAEATAAVKAAEAVLETEKATLVKAAAVKAEEAVKAAAVKAAKPAGTIDVSEAPDVMAVSGYRITEAAVVAGKTTYTIDIPDLALRGKFCNRYKSFAAELGVSLEDGKIKAQPAELSKLLAALAASGLQPQPQTQCFERTYDDLSGKKDAVVITSDKRKFTEALSNFLDTLHEGKKGVPATGRYNGTKGKFDLTDGDLINLRNLDDEKLKKLAAIMGDKSGEFTNVQHLFNGLKVENPQLEKLVEKPISSPPPV